MFLIVVNAGNEWRSGDEVSVDLRLEILLNCPQFALEISPQAKFRVIIRRRTIMTSSQFVLKTLWTALPQDHTVRNRHVQIAHVKIGNTAHN